VNRIVIEISPGELVDRTTILRLKSARIADPLKLEIVRAELVRHERLVAVLAPDDELPRLVELLLEINARLWEVEEAIRSYECARDLGPKFVELARTVYRTNDERAATKRKINLLLGASITEVKSYGQR
jgi:hypothetical protein